jgi:hypothetical protein
VPSGGLGDRKAELEQLTMNVRRTPECILNVHPLDQRPEIRIDLRPAVRTENQILQYW